VYRLVLALAFAFAMHAQYGIGRTATPDEIRSADITIFPDGRGLPAGHGNAAAGENVYSGRCVSCHGPKGIGKAGEYPALAGGRGTLNTTKPVKTVGSYWPYATTVWDHINRAMPFNAPHVLKPNEVYAVTAYILYLNGLITRDQELDEKTLPKIVMPNRNGFLPDNRPDIKSQR
jgi:mono/diheme cytochrome c family protein